jgi:AmmeMemoRadiSam system protein B
MRSVRRAAVAGAFYPSNATRLAKDVDELLSGVPVPDKSESFNAIVPRASFKAAIVPHAGYVYSGAVAATAYALIRAANGRVRRVVILGPSHFARIHGLAIPLFDAMRTPLGEIAIDPEWVKRATRLPQVVHRDEANSREHSLEVQLPFLQRALNEFTVVPLAVGDTEPEVVARVIEELWGGKETVILVSSDLSHYLPYDLALKTDRRTAARVLNLESVLVPNEDACGATPINGLLQVASRKGLRPSLLDLQNSGDTAGPRSEVVGYGSFAFFET